MRMRFGSFAEPEARGSLPAIILLAASAMVAAADDQVWCTHSTVKVFPDSPPGEARSLSLALARREWESAQIVVRLEAAGRRVEFQLPEMPGLELELRRVEYVPVLRPTESGGPIGEWPDPLVPLEGPLDLTPGRNHVFWLTVRAVGEAGDREGEIVLPGLVRIPLRVRVWNFSLPDRLRTRTAYGVHLDQGWHALETLAQRREVHDLYMQACRDYRISPYDPFAYHDPAVRDGALDFSDFDRAGRRYLDDFGFSSFVFRFPLELEGHAAFTREYREALAREYGPRVEHLRRMGWLDLALAYWIDEPRPAQAGRVEEWMRAVKECLPGVRRLLTANLFGLPRRRFHGLVDVWVPVLHQFGAARAAARQALGEEVWWYVCTQPKDPFPNNFIDRPALHPRIRYWLMSRWNLQGDLYWSATYWRHKNPWKDAMSYTAEGNGLWGNGDGYLFYPPVREPPAAPVIAGPIPSQRLAMIRDGLEDMEYLHLLLERGGEDLLAEAHALVPSAKEFARDPARLLDLRRRIGEFLGR